MAALSSDSPVNEHCRRPTDACSPWLFVSILARAASVDGGSPCCKSSSSAPARAPDSSDGPRVVGRMALPPRGSRAASSSSLLALRVRMFQASCLIGHWMAHCVSEWVQ